MVQCVTDCGECGTGWSSIGSSVQGRLTNVFSLENRGNSFYGEGSSRRGRPSAHRRQAGSGRPRRAEAPPGSAVGGGVTGLERRSGPGCPLPSARWCPPAAVGAEEERLGARKRRQKPCLRPPGCRLGPLVPSPLTRAGPLALGRPRPLRALRRTARTVRGLRGA